MTLTELKKGKKLDSLPKVSDVFINDNKQFLNTQFNSRNKKGGPYSKGDREARKNEVYRLHFEYGYSARKIAELMKINRNTVNGDIDYWYSKISIDTNILNPTLNITIIIEHFKIQRIRLREQLDKATIFHEKITLERLIHDLDFKILNTYQRLSESSLLVHKLATNWLNNYMKKQKRDNRYITFYDTISISKKSK